MDRHEFLLAGMFSGLPYVDTLLAVIGSLIPLGLAWRAVRISDPISQIVSFAGMVAWTGFLMFIAFPELSSTAPPALYLTLIVIGLVAMVNIDLGRLDSLTQQLCFAIGMFSLTLSLMGWWLPAGPPFPSKTIFIPPLFIGIAGVCVSKIFQTIAKQRRDRQS